MRRFSFEVVVNNLLLLDRQRPTAFRGPRTAQAALPHFYGSGHPAEVNV